ncbi:DAK2 domain-containing protein [Tropicimonas marinistellae]|uniref:DAK2 domain-containing protein n=1 Tax=Tropicimonas marinistellae TaxID=1739787 RepID=UPI00082FB0B8|nr:DAK2 domain-containing protein [Tropicimonas marinistellae]
MSGFTTENLRHAAARIADHADAVAASLNEADGKLGDGDLGITVSAGWREIADHAEALPDDLGKAFMECAKCFQRASSSSFGTLVATGLMSTAKACKGREAVPWAAVSALIAAAGEAMKARGKGNLGDKCVLDSMDAMARATSGLDDPAALQAAAFAAATETLETFRDRPNRLGRARMFGEKSIGLDDPGQLAALEMARALA